MKKIIESLGMSIKEFSTYYEIPYNTVRQWWNGDRTPPKWVIKLLNELIDSKKNGEQLKIHNEKLFIIEYKTIYDTSETNSYSCYEKEYERTRAIKCFFDRTENYKTIKVYEVDKTPV